MNNQINEERDPSDADVKRVAKEEKKASKRKPSKKDISFGKDVSKAMGPKKRGAKGGIEGLRARIQAAGQRGKEELTDSLDDHIEYKRMGILIAEAMGYKINEILGALATGAIGAVGGMLAKKAFGKTAKKKAEEKRKAQLAAQQTVPAPGEEEMEESLGSKVWKGAKETARVAGLVPGVGIVGDAVAGGMTAAQLAVTKDKEKRSSLKKELAGDALAAIPGAGLGTRGAQYAAKGAKVAGKAVKGGKGAGKLRSKAGAAVRMHGTTAAKAGGEALEQKAREKSKELRQQEGSQLRTKYLQALKEADSRTRGEAGTHPDEGPPKPVRGADREGGEVVSPGRVRRKIEDAPQDFLKKWKKATKRKVTPRDK